MLNKCGWGKPKVFLIVEPLSIVDGMVGLIDLRTGTLHQGFGIEQMNDFIVNFIEIEKMDFHTATKVMKIRAKVFADHNETLPYNPKIVATIRMVDNKSVYLNGIVWPFRLRYNTSVWVVDEKGVGEIGNKKKREVISDFRKLTEQTIDDK